MNIFYVSGTGSRRKFKSLFEESKIKPQQQAQKFHHLFLKGLEQFSNQIYVMSVLPINRNSSKNIWISGEKEKEENTIYRYLPFVNFPILKHLVIFLISIFTLMFWSYRTEKNSRVLICDVLNVTSSAAALVVSKILRVKSVAIVTDIPSYLNNYTNETYTRKHITFIKWIYGKVCHFFMCRYDSYILLTEQMNDLVNPYHKPFVVIEGMVDSNMKHVPNTLEEKYEEKIIIYAGALYEKYGVKRLIKAFMKLEMKDTRLWLFGDGELVNEIRRYEEEDNRIKYFGVVPNEWVVKEEIKATLLVNPRPSDEEFTKYSFPSKNMEYMASGTPIVTTKLSGIPSEYLQHIYLFRKETEEGIAVTLKNILSKSKEDLYNKGSSAKAFVLKEKNNIVQAKRFIETLL